MIRNVLAYSLQIAVVVTAAAALLAILRPRAPKVRMAFLQMLLVGCLALPLLQTWQTPPAPAAVSGAGPVIAVPRRISPPEPSPFDWNRAAMVLLCGGMVARALWLLLGLWRLRGYRATSAPLDIEPDAIRHARQLAGADADVRLSLDLATPATFGFLRPVVLLPRQFEELPPATQSAVAVHELLHVRRLDWLWTLAEEFVSVVFWFHPAVAWLISRIRLAREQHVDEAVAERTGSRDAYVDALMTMAAGNQASWSPAPLFLHRRTLSERIRNLIEEAPMSYRRSLVTYTGIAVVAVMAAGFAVTRFPLAAAAQAASAGVGPVSIEAGGVIESQMPIRYPMVALGKRIEGVVVVDVTLADDGTVADARVVSGPEELRKPVLQSVLQWRYKKGENPSHVYARIGFRVPETLPRAPANRVLRKIDVAGLPADKQQSFHEQLDGYVGRPMEEASPAITRAMRDLSPAAGIKWQIDPATGDTAITILAGDQLPGSGANASFEFAPPAPGVKRIKIGGNVQANKLLLQVPPQYPALARQARIQGTVRFQVLINRDGTVNSLAMMNGHPLLAEAAQEAVRQWTWQTTLLNGEPVEVITVVDVNFTLTP